MKNNIKWLMTLAVCVFSLVPNGDAQTRKPGEPRLTFGEYLERVGTNNLEYLSEQYNVSIAEAEIALQKVLPDPEITFEGADEAFNLELGYTLELGKRRSRVDQARTEADIEKLALEWFFQELRAQAADAFLEALLQKKLLEVKRDSYLYMAQLYTYDSLRYRIGEIAENDARQTYIEASTLLNEVYMQEGEYLASLAALNLYMGDDSGSLEEPADADWEVISNPYQIGELIALGRENRVDLLAGGKAMELAVSNLRTVRAERRPDIDLMVGYERDWNGFWPRRNMVKAGITVPLKFSNINKGAVRQAEYMIGQSETQARSLELQVQTDITQAYYRTLSLEKQVGQYRTGLLDEARELLDGMTFRYRRGEIDILELLIAQRTFNEVREQYLETMKEYASSVVELHRNAGIWHIGF